MFRTFQAPLSNSTVIFLQKKKRKEKKVTSQEISKQNLQDLSEILSGTLSDT